MVQEALVDVPDLLNVESTERKAARLGWSAARNPHTENLQCFQQVKHDTVVNFERRCGGRPPSRIFCATFEKRITVGIEQGTTIRWKSHRFMLYSPVYRAESSK